MPHYESYESCSTLTGFVNRIPLYVGTEYRLII